MPKSGLVVATVLLFAALPAIGAENQPPQLPTDEVIPTTAPPVPQPAATPSLEEVHVEAPEPRYVAPTLRDSIGRIWVPVLINGQGPFRLVLDTGASKSALLPRVARALNVPMQPAAMRVHGVTGSADVSTIHIQQSRSRRAAHGSLDPADRARHVRRRRRRARQRGARRQAHLHRLPPRPDRDHALAQRASQRGHEQDLLKLTRGRLLAFQTRIGSVATTAIIDTGAQRTIGNQALRTALNRRARNWQQEEIIGVTLDVERGDNLRRRRSRWARRRSPARA